MTPLTCVSSYFQIKNKHGDSFKGWFKNTLAIPCPYVFFTNKESIDMIKSFRKDLPTYYIECEIEDFYTYKYKDKMITDPRHCPSVELNLIWNEKIFMIQTASKLNPFKSEWFKWIDAGICTYRMTPPPQSEFPNRAILNALPKDKFIYSASNPFRPELITSTSSRSHISGTYIIHNTLIPTIVDLYKKYLDKLVARNIVWTDQEILTHIYKDNQELFFKLCDGYGTIAVKLFE
jgi:hypothetical protein